MIVSIEVSARHVHLSAEVLEKLFGENHKLTFMRDLSQPGQFLCEERVEVIGPRNKLSNVAVLGPERSRTQVEISLTDARKIGVEAHIRESGDLDETASCILRGPCGEIELKSGVIVAKRHIHMNTMEAQNMGVVSGQICRVKVRTDERSLVFGDVVIRVSDNFSLAMHIDTDEGNAMSWKSGISGDIIL